jgi:xylose isomerase
MAFVFDEYAVFSWRKIHLFNRLKHLSMVLQKRKTIVMIGLVSCISIALFAFRNSEVQPRWKNLKVLPASISHDSLDMLMDDYKAALNIKCSYCHAPSKDNPRRMDMASDANPKKDIARTMIRMTMELNQKYISTVPHSDTAKLVVVTCNTCHRGQAIPSK